MPPRSDSDLPTPFRPGKDRGEEHQMRADCSAAFASITATMKAVRDDVRGMRSEVSEIGKSQAALEQSARGLWHEIRDEVQPGLVALPDRISDTVRAHASECPARRKAMRRAESNGNSNLGVQPYGDDPTGRVEIPHGRFIRQSTNGHYEIPRPILWVGGLIGAAVAASGWVLHALGMI